MSIVGGTRNLHWLLTGNFALMLLAVPLFGWIVTRFPRRKFIPLLYRFFYS
jgi:AAA family ATP:ADP antiporter